MKGRRQGRAVGWLVCGETGAGVGQEKSWELGSFNDEAGFTKGVGRKGNGEMALVPLIMFRN